MAAGSQLLTLPRTSWDRATGSKDTPEGAGMGASTQQRQPAIWVVRGRLREGPVKIPPRSPVLLALLASAPRDRKERIRVSVCQPGTGPTLGTWPSWLRGHVKGATFSWGWREQGGLCARGLGSGVGPCEGRPGSRGHLCLSSFGAWGFSWGGRGVGRRFSRREFSLRGVACRRWLCSWS